MVTREKTKPIRKPGKKAPKATDTVQRPLIFIGFIALLFLLFTPFSPLVFIFAVLGMGVIAEGLIVPPTLLVDIIIFILFCLIGRVLLERKTRGVTVLRLVIACIICIVLANIVTIPIYRAYRVATLPENMEIHLEKKYGKEFVVTDAKYVSSGQLGTKPAVQASASPVDNPSFKFSVSEDSNDTNREYDYNDGLTQKLSFTENDLAHKIIGSNLKAIEPDLEYVGKVIYNSQDKEKGLNGYKGVSRKLDVTLNETLTSSDWQHYRNVLVDASAFLHSTEYKDMGFTFTVRDRRASSTPSDLDCKISSEELKTKDKVEAAFGKCAHNSYLDIYLKANAIQL